MKTKPIHLFIVILLAIYLLLPLAGTLVYSLSKNWSTTILPESWTFSWYIQLFQDERFFQALGRSIFVIAGGVGLSMVIMLITIFVVLLYFPKQEMVLKLISMLPYGVPAVASAIGLLNLYSSSTFTIVGTPWILIGIYAVIIIPFVYQGIRNSLYSVNAIELIQAAELLGASKVKAILSVVLPNISKGILAATLLSISMLFGEFALANILVGGRYETLQIYLYQQLSKNGHLTSAIVISYYTIIIIITGFLLTLQSKKSSQTTKKKSIFLKTKQPMKISIHEGEVK
ncbi:Putative 2-aminoethylphosphonate transport system permease protein PhnV [Bacillus sp. THAF10]|uniref:ABC transporter permease n=1 Tax=Bacillus sp. THAF10 TaxID=2587848 RepID=UPI0012678A5E|nr:ABC transporter permease subunit [Bacillus sp. THAF10]QFT91145.1 Putative 2-aminoethylphosphonate transport system permease protein PhnV [Bacillus sp. THAF10]